MASAMKKVPKGMVTLSPKTKKDSPNKPYVWDPRPEISVKSEDLPAIESWDVGKEYTLEVKVKMEEYREGTNSDSGKVEKRACLRIIAIGVEEKE
jgi:hypothetical protein